MYKHILYIGPQHKKHRGGIGAVLASYATHIDDFKFIATYHGRYGGLQNIAFFIVSLLQLIWTLLRDRDIKIIHIHGASNNSFSRKYIVFFIAKFLFNKKVVYHLHGAKFHIYYEKSNPLTQHLINHLAESVDVFICLSSYWRNYLSEKFNIGNLAIINNPVSLTENRKNSVKDICKSGTLDMLFLGRIGDRKGIFDLLEVINICQKQWKGKIKLIIGGDGEVERLKKYIEAHKLSAMVEYVGWVDDEKKHQLLLEIDVLILPSYNEGLPISILEAMNYGKAIIATDVGGISEVVADDNGFLIEPGNKEQLQSSINNLITAKKSVLKKMGLISIEKVMPYTIEKVIKQLKEIYTPLLIKK